MKSRFIFKRIFCAILAIGVLFAGGINIFSATEGVIITPVSVFLDGERVLEGERGALLVNGVTYVPLRAFCTLMGAGDIIWNGETRQARVTCPGLDITLSEGAQYIMVNDRAFYSPAPAFIREGTLFVPIRVMSKAYGIEVEWCVPDGGGMGFVKLTSCGRRAEDASDVYDSEVLYWLSRIISADSRGESLLGQIAVGNVVLNRTRDANFPDTVYDVIFDRKYGVQFTPIVNGSIYENPAESSIIAAKICLEGYTVSDKILYFLNESISANLWVPNNRTHIITIGNHAFYS